MRPLLMSKHEIPPQLLKHPFWFYVRQNPRALAVGMFFLVATNVLDGLWPLVLKEGLDLISAKASLNELTRISLIFFLIMGSLSLTRFGWRMGFGRFHTLTAEDLRRRSFARLARLPVSFFQKNPVGELMSLITNDVQAFRQAVGNGVLVFADGVLILAVILPVMFQLNASWTWKVLVFMPFVPFVIWWVTKKIHVAYKHQQEVFGRLTAHCQETVSGVRVVKGFALEKVRLDSFNKESRAFEQACNGTARVDAFFMPVMELGVTTGTIIFLFVARDELLAGTASIGTFVAFHRYILKTVWPVTALGLGLSQLQKGFASFERIRQMVSTPSDLAETGSLQPEKFESLEFRGVGFRYPGQDNWALRNLNFVIRRGQSWGLLGPVGAGKSTLACLITRQYDPTEGEILLNGRPLRDYDLVALRSCLSLVPQDVFLFSETVMTNLGFARDESLSPEAARDMAHEVALHDEIEKLPQGYSSLIGEKGVTLSGGQKQRLALARGLLRDSEFLILDDVMSAVDTRTEKIIESTLSERRRQGQGQLLVAHRLSTLSSCDHWLVLNEGRLESAGPRDQVLASSDFARRLQSIQERHEEEVSPS